MKRNLAGVFQETTNETAHCESVEVVFAELSEASGSLNESTTQAAVNEMFLMRLEVCSNSYQNYVRLSLFRVASLLSLRSYPRAEIESPKA